MLRIIDESGEDYLYPKAFFAQVAVPGELAERLHKMTAWIPVLAEKGV